MPGSWFHDMYRDKDFDASNSHTYHDQPRGINIIGGTIECRSSLDHTKITTYRRLCYLVSPNNNIRGTYFLYRKDQTQTRQPSTGNVLQLA